MAAHSTAASLPTVLPEAEASLVEQLGSEEESGWNQQQHLVTTLEPKNELDHILLFHESVPRLTTSSTCANGFSKPSVTDLYLECLDYQQSSGDEFNQQRHPFEWIPVDFPTTNAPITGSKRTDDHSQRGGKIYPFSATPYHVVVCLDQSPSMGSVDASEGIMVEFGFQNIKTASWQVIEPKIILSVFLDHAPFHDEGHQFSILLHEMPLEKCNFLQVIGIVYAALNAKWKETASIQPASSINHPSNLHAGSLARRSKFALLLLGHAKNHYSSAIVHITDNVSPGFLGSAEDEVWSQIVAAGIPFTIIQVGSSFGYSPLVNFGYVPDTEAALFITQACNGRFVYSIDLKHTYYIESSDGDRAKRAADGPNEYHLLLLSQPFSLSEASQRISPGTDALSTNKRQRAVDEPRSVFGNQKLPDDLSYPWEWQSHPPCIPEILCGYRDYAVPVSASVLLACRLHQGFTVESLDVAPRNQQRSKVDILLVYHWIPNVTIYYAIRYFITTGESVLKNLKSPKVELNLRCHHTFALLFVNMNGMEDHLEPGSPGQDLETCNLLPVSLSRLHLFLNGVVESDMALEFFFLHSNDALLDTDPYWDAFPTTLTKCPISEERIISCLPLASVTSNVSFFEIMNNFLEAHSSFFNEGGIFFKKIDVTDNSSSKGLVLLSISGNAISNLILLKIQCVDMLIKSRSRYFKALFDDLEAVCRVVQFPFDITTLATDNQTDSIFREWIHKELMHEYSWEMCLPESLEIDFDFSNMIDRLNSVIQAQGGILINRSSNSSYLFIHSPGRGILILLREHPATENVPAKLEVFVWALTDVMTEPSYTNAVINLQSSFRDCFNRSFTIRILNSTSASLTHYLALPVTVKIRDGLPSSIIAKLDFSLLPSVSSFGSSVYFPIMSYDTEEVYQCLKMELEKSGPKVSNHFSEAVTKFTTSQLSKAISIAVPDCVSYQVSEGTNSSPAEIFASSVKVGPKLLIVAVSPSSVRRDQGCVVISVFLLDQSESLCIGDQVPFIPSTEAEICSFQVGDMNAPLGESSLPSSILNRIQHFLIDIAQKARVSLSFRKLPFLPSFPLHLPCFRVIQAIDLNLSSLCHLHCSDCKDHFGDLAFTSSFVSMMEACGFQRYHDIYYSRINLLIVSVSISQGSEATAARLSKWITDEGLRVQKQLCEKDNIPLDDLFDRHVPYMLSVRLLSANSVTSTMRTGMKNLCSALNKWISVQSLVSLATCSQAKLHCDFNLVFSMLEELAHDIPADTSTSNDNSSFELNPLISSDLFDMTISAYPISDIGIVSTAYKIEISVLYNLGSDVFRIQDSEDEFNIELLTGSADDGACNFILRSLHDRPRDHECFAEPIYWIAGRNGATDGDYILYAFNVQLSVLKRLANFIHDKCTKIIQRWLLSDLWARKEFSSLICPTSKSIESTLSPIQDVESPGSFLGDLEAKFEAGRFCCPVVYSHHFAVHPRVDVLALHVSILRVMSFLGLLNVPDIFVSKDSNEGIFYMLWEIDLTARHLTLLVYGLGNPGRDIVIDLVSMLQSKMSVYTCSVFGDLLLRHPTLPLTLPDVEFILNGLLFSKRFHIAMPSELSYFLTDFRTQFGGGTSGNFIPVGMNLIAGKLSTLFKRPSGIANDPHEFAFLYNQLQHKLPLGHSGMLLFLYIRFSEIPVGVESELPAFPLSASIDPILQAITENSSGSISQSDNLAVEVHLWTLLSFNQETVLSSVTEKLAGSMILDVASKIITDLSLRLDQERNSGKDSSFGPDTKDLLAKSSHAITRLLQVNEAPSSQFWWLPLSATCRSEFLTAFQRYCRNAVHLQLNVDSPLYMTSLADEGGILSLGAFPPGVSQAFFGLSTPYVRGKSQIALFHFQANEVIISGVGWKPEQLANLFEILVKGVLEVSFTQIPLPSSIASGIFDYLRLKFQMSPSSSHGGTPLGSSMALGPSSSAAPRTALRRTTHSKSMAVIVNILHTLRRIVTMESQLIVPLDSSCMIPYFKYLGMEVTSDPSTGLIIASTEISDAGIEDSAAKSVLLFSFFIEGTCARLSVHLMQVGVADLTDDRMYEGRVSEIVRKLQFDAYLFQCHIEAFMSGKFKFGFETLLHFSKSAMCEMGRSSSRKYKFHVGRYEIPSHHTMSIYNIILANPEKYGLIMGSGHQVERQFCYRLSDSPDFGVVSSGMNAEHGIQVAGSRVGGEVKYGLFLSSLGGTGQESIDYVITTIAPLSGNQSFPDATTFVPLIAGGNLLQQPPTPMEQYMGQGYYFTDVIRKCESFIHDRFTEASQVYGRDALWRTLVQECGQANAPMSLPSEVNVILLETMSPHARPLTRIDPWLGGILDVRRDWRPALYYLYSIFPTTSRILLGERGMKLHLLLFNPADSDYVLQFVMYRHEGGLCIAARTDGLDDDACLSPPIEGEEGGEKTTFSLHVYAVSREGIQDVCEFEHIGVVMTRLISFLVRFP